MRNGKVTLLAILYLSQFSTLFPASARAAADDGSEIAGETHLLDPITVTAEKRMRSLMQTPQSMSVLTSEVIRDSGVLSLGDTSGMIPNLHFTEFSGQRLIFPFLRGIGPGLRNPAVGVYIDGVPQYSVNTFNIEFLNIASIEVLRGPQGVLYGRNTLGGAINLISERPTEQAAFDFQSVVGNYDLQRHRLKISTPLRSNENFLDGAGLFMERDGFTRNEMTDDSLNDVETASGLIRMAFGNKDGSRITFSLFGQRDRDGTFVPYDITELRRDPHRVRYDFEGHSSRDIVNSTITLDMHGHRHDMKLITSYLLWESDNASDSDFTEFDSVRRFTLEKERQFFQEFRLLSADTAPIDVVEGIELNWILGMLYFTTGYESDATDSLRFIDVEDKTEARLRDVGTGGYGQTVITFFDRLDLTLGIRYDYEEKHANLGNEQETVAGRTVSFARGSDRSFNEWSKRIGLSYLASTDAMVYGYIADGYRTGGFNTRAPAGEIDYDPEQNLTYELGIKRFLLDNRLTINASLFYIDWKDMQFFVPDIAAPGRFFVDNVGASRSQGFELELLYRVANGWSAAAGFGYTDAEFLDYVDPVVGNVDGKSLTFAPEYTVNAGLQKTLRINDDLECFGRIDVTGVGEYFYDPGNTEGQGSYFTTNLRLGVRGPTVTVVGWVRNLFDKETIPVAFQLPDRSFVGESGNPREYGISIALRF